jgi:hypothetical protein
LTHRRWKRDQGRLVALAEHLEHAVTATFSQCGHLGPGRLEDAQPEQPQHGDKREVIPIRRVAPGTQHGLELQVAEPEGRRFGWDVGSADVLGRRVFEDAVDHAGPVEGSEHREPARDGGGPEAAHLLEPTQVELDVAALGLQGHHVALETPAQV